MKNQFKDRTIYQAGFARSGDWILVGRGSSIEAAKADLFRKRFSCSLTKECLEAFRYEESSYVETAIMQERDQ